MSEYLNKIVYLSQDQYDALMASTNNPKTITVDGITHTYDASSLYITSNKGDADTVNGHTVNIDVPYNAIFTDHYHTTGTWNDITYTATSVNGANPLTSTLPTDNRYYKLDGSNTGSKLSITHTANNSKELEFKYSTTIDYWWGVGTANVNHGLYDEKASGSTKWILSAGSDNVWTFVGNVTGNVSGSSGSCTGNATTASAVGITTHTNTTNGNKTYYLPFLTATSGNLSPRAHSAVYLYETVSSGAISKYDFCFGASAIQGSITLWDGSSHWGNISTTNLSGNRTYTLPNANGTIALTSSDITGNADTATTATNLSAAPTITQAGSSGTALSAATFYTLTVGGQTVVFKTPTDTNDKVTQNVKTDNKKYGIILSNYETSASTTTAAAVNRDSKVYVNPSLNSVNAGQFVLHDKAATPVEKAYMIWNATDQSIDFVFN